MRIADSHSDFLAYRVLEDTDTRLFDHVDSTRLMQGGVALQCFAVWVPPEHPHAMQACVRQIEYLQTWVRRTNSVLCRKADDLKTGGGLKAVLAIESGESIGCRIDGICRAYGLGARLLSLTWNGENDFASGCLYSGGLKPLGIAAVHELNRLGMGLDLSHINEQGFWEAVRIYEGAPCATHSCVYDLLPHPRNLKKDQIQRIIAGGGYIGVNFYTEFLRGRRATVEDVLDHIEYILSCGGEDAAGLGSDFCGIQYTPDGLDSAADFQKIPEAMARRGYPQPLIYKICYGNFEKYILKFLKQV